jgi:hypothetical protein
MEIDREILKELSDLTIEEVKGEGPIDEPDESLCESVLHQYKLFETTINFSKGIKDLIKCRDLSDQSIDVVGNAYETPTLASTFDRENTIKTNLKDSINNDLKQNAQLWYKQFAEQSNKWTIGQNKPSDSEEFVSSVQTSVN